MFVKHCPSFQKNWAQIFTFFHLKNMILTHTNDFCFGGGGVGGKIPTHQISPKNKIVKFFQ
jgi:hypothetical protein